MLYNLYNPSNLHVLGILLYINKTLAQNLNLLTVNNLVYIKLLEFLN